MAAVTLRLAILCGFAVSVGDVLGGGIPFDVKRESRPAIDAGFFLPKPSVTIANGGSDGLMADFKTAVSGEIPPPTGPAGFQVSLGVKEFTSVDAILSDLDPLKPSPVVSGSVGLGFEALNPYLTSVNSGKKIYDLEARSEKSVLLDRSLVGSGHLAESASPMPQSVFTADATAKPNLFQFFQLGITDRSQGGRSGGDAGPDPRNSLNSLTYFAPQEVPEPGTIGAAGVVTALVLGSGLLRRHRRAKTSTEANATPANQE